MNEIADKLGHKRVVNPNSLLALKAHEIKKGEIRNPKGRPRKADSLINCIKSELDKLSLNGKQTNMELFAAVLVMKATRGDDRAGELLMSYLAARPAQKQELDVTTKGEAIGNGHVEIPEQHFRDALLILAQSGISQN